MFRFELKRCMKGRGFKAAFLISLILAPAIHVVLLGDDARALLNTFSEGDTEDDEPEI